MNRKPIIAIDGFSSTGKSSISKQIAKILGVIHMDTGALYRGITWYALQNCKTADGSIDKTALFGQLDSIKLEFIEKEGVLILYLNGKDISNEIRTLEVSNNVSYIAKQAEIRNFLMETQRTIAKNGGVVMDGRDIGTVVLPDADYKFFLTASIDERTKRRHTELLSLGQQAEAEEVKINLITRDRIDSEREVSPLKQADDAILIDNTHLNQKETLELILSYIK